MKVNLYSKEYKENIYNISDGKWALTPALFLEDNQDLKFLL
jgi:hypothetical protein